MKQKHLITRVVFNYSAILGPQRGPNRDPRGSPRAPILCFLVFHILPLDIFQIRPVTSFFSQTFKNYERNNVNYQIIQPSLVVLNPYLHTKIQYITKMSLWKAGQSFLAKIDYFFKVDHISKKLTLALFDIRPTTHLVCTLLYIQT